MTTILTNQGNQSIQISLPSLRILSRKTRCWISRHSPESSNRKSLASVRLQTASKIRIDTVEALLLLSKIWASLQMSLQIKCSQEFSERPLLKHAMWWSSKKNHSSLQANRVVRASKLWKINWRQRIWKRHWPARRYNWKQKLLNKLNRESIQINLKGYQSSKQTMKQYTTPYFKDWRHAQGLGEMSCKNLSLCRNLVPNSSPKSQDKNLRTRVQPILMALQRPWINGESCLSLSWETCPASLESISTKKVVWCNRSLAARATRNMKRLGRRTSRIWSGGSSRCTCRSGSWIGVQPGKSRRRMARMRLQSNQAPWTSGMNSIKAARSRDWTRTSASSWTSWQGMATSIAKKPKSKDRL